MKTKHERIEELALSVLPRFAAYLIQVQTRGERGETVVQVLVDTDAGVTIDECAGISRDLARLIEEEALFDGRYRLEVSSPGLDKPLRDIRQYQKNIGRPFRVRFRGAEQEEAADVVLAAVEGSSLRFDLGDGTTRVVDVGDIIDCRHRLPW